MSYGINIKNLDNYTQIDEKYASFVVAYQLSITSTYVSNNNVLVIPDDKLFYDGSMYAIRKISDSNNSINFPLNGSRYRLNVFNGYIIVPLSGTYEVVILRDISKVTTPTNISNQGLEVYSNNGNKNFSSNYPMFRITHIFSVPLDGNSPSNGTWTFNYSQMPFDKPLYYMCDDPDGFKKTSGVYWYYWPTGIITSSTQTQLSLQRISVSDPSPGNSVLFRTRLGIIV